MAALTSRMPRVPHALSTTTFALGPLVAMALGCSGDHLTREPPLPPESLYWALDLNHHAVTLSLQAPYDTLTLVATPRNSRGEPLPGLGTPEYRSLDLERVLVMPDGVLRAVALTEAGQPVLVQATLRAERLTLIDTVLVRVVADTLPKLASLSIDPIPPDSAKTGVLTPDNVAFFGSPLSVRAIDSTGASIEDPLIMFRSSDPSTATAVYHFGRSMPAALHGWELGTVNLEASATIFGVTRADTVRYQVGWPVSVRVEVRRTVNASGDSVVLFSPQEIWVGTGALVIFSSRLLSDTTDVTFTPSDIANILPADSSHVLFTSLARLRGISASVIRNSSCRTNDCDSGGNAMLVPERTGAVRVFSAPGTYEYRSTRSGASGRIIVVNERP